MAIILKRYKDGSYTSLRHPLSREMTFGNMDEDSSSVSVPKKKSLIRRYASKLLDNAANGLIRGTGNKPMY